MARTLTFTKAILVINNFLFLLGGGALLAGGLWLHYDTEVVSLLKIMETSPSGPHLKLASYCLIGVGSFVLFLSFMGCCGACCESMCMLCLYSCFLMLVLASEITGGTLLLVFRNKLLAMLQLSMHEQVKIHYNRTLNSQGDVLTKVWDRMQVNMKCCGAQGPQDYRYSYWFNHTQGTGNFVPATCCYLTNDSPEYPQVRDENQCQIDAILYPEEIPQSQAVKTDGCHYTIEQWLMTNSSIFTGCFVTVIILQVAGLIVACCLMSAIKKEQSKFPWYLEDDDD